MEVNLKKILKDYNMLQKELAYVIGVKESTASNYVSGARKISLESMMKLAKHLNVPLDNLISDSETITITKQEFKKLQEAKQVFDEFFEKYK